MKILLIGEFSGLHKNLASGLRFLDHEVVLASSGDGKKAFSRDIDISTNLKSKPFKSVVNIFKLLKLARGFDVVQFIYPILFYPLIDPYVYKRIIKNNKKSFLIAAGTDYRYIKSCSEFRYNPYSPMVENNEFKFINQLKYFSKWNNELVELVDGVIPSMYEYALGYSKNSNKLDTIPLPLDLNGIEYKENIVKNEIVILYGRTRPGFKGEKHILPALKRVKENFSNVEVKIIENLPINKYLEELKSCNILIDQCNSYSYGMNAVFGMALGKVVFSGNEPECRKEFQQENIPIINIVPDENMIYKEICNHLDAIKIKKIGGLSRQFVESFHNHEKIASRYIYNWGKV